MGITFLWVRLEWVELANHCPTSFQDFFFNVNEVWISHSKNFSLLQSFSNEDRSRNIFSENMRDVFRGSLLLFVHIDVISPKKWEYENALERERVTMISGIHSWWIIHCNVPKSQIQNYVRFEILSFLT